MVLTLAVAAVALAVLVQAAATFLVLRGAEVRLRHRHSVALARRGRLPADQREVAWLGGALTRQVEGFLEDVASFPAMSREGTSPGRPGDGRHDDV